MTDLYTLLKTRFTTLFGDNIYPSKINAGILPSPSLVYSVISENYAYKQRQSNVQLTIYDTTYKGVNDKADIIVNSLKDQKNNSFGGKIISISIIGRQDLGFIPEDNLHSLSIELFIKSIIA